MLSRSACRGKPFLSLPPRVSCRLRIGVALTAHLTLEPDIPRDPLAAADSADWALARRAAVLGLPLDAESRGLLVALAELDRALAAALAVPLQRSEVAAAPDAAAAPAPGPIHRGAPTDELPAVSILDDDAEIPDIPPTPDDDITELGADDLTVEPEAVADTYVRQVSGDRKRMAAAETLVLSGPDIKRKIRHKQSIMPSFAGQILLEDIVSLQALEDKEGAVVSLERLLTIAPMSAQVEAFLSHNEAKLLQYYEMVFGPLTRIARLKETDTGMPPGYFRLPKIRAVVQLLDGTRTVADVLGAAGLRRIEACAVLSQLSRAGCLDLR